MKIVYVYEIFYLSGGIPKIQTLKANYLSEQCGHQITIITDINNKNRHFFPLNQNIEIEYIDFKDLDFQQKLTEKIQNVNPDIVSCIADTREFSFLGRIKGDFKKIAEFRTNYRIIKGFSNIRYNFRKWISERKRLIKFVYAAKKFDAFVVLTNDDKKFFSKYFLKITIIPNPIQAENFYEKPHRKKAIAVGRLEPVKGFDKLISIWKIVAEKHPDWELHIFGEGPLLEEFRQKIKTFDLEKNIVLNNPVKDILKEYAESSIHLMTSLYEGFGNVLTEAMVSEIPSIAFNCGGGPEELIDNGKTGFLIKTNDKKDFVEKINLLIENEKLRFEMGKAAKQKSRNYSQEIIMEKWENLLYGLVKNDR